MSILALERKQKKKSFQSKEWKKTKRENSQSKIERKKKKKGKKILDQGSKKKQKKYAERSLDQTSSEQIQSYHQVNKKERKPQRKVVLSLRLPTKIQCGGGLFTQKQHKKQPKIFPSSIPKKKKKNNIFSSKFPKKICDRIEREKKKKKK